jgi:hypothetical protein
MSAVTVTITNKRVGTWNICPYNATEGIDRSVSYKVPIYEVTVGDKDTFKAVRFGLVRRNEKPPPTTRVCDAGLADAQTVRPGWIPDYNPHSFEGGPRVGAWQLYAGKGWLIHEGAGDPSQQSGSLGCIEVVGKGEWDRFLSTIEALAGATCAEIGKAKALTVVLQAASRPTAERVSP